MLIVWFSWFDLATEQPLWVTSRPWGEALNGSAAKGQADEIRWKADVRTRKSACWGKAAVPEHALECVLLANTGSSRCFR